VGYYFVKDTTQVKKEGLSHLEYRFLRGRYRKHNPKYLVSKHVVHVVSYWPYACDNFEDEVYIENAQDWDEVLQRRANLDLTQFRSMSMDEHFEFINKTTKEFIREHNERERE